MNKTRLNILFAFIVALSGVLVFRLYQIQIKEVEHWSDRAERQQKVTQETEGSRGSIFAQNQNGEAIPLAIDRIWKKVYISPKELKESEEDKQRIISDLIDILNLEEEVIKSRIEKKDSSFEVLKRQLSSSEVEKIEELEFAGVYLRDEELRFYPQRNLASHVIGFVGGTGIGQYGIEGYYDDLLRGMSGVRQGIRSPGSFIVIEDSTRTGMSIDLTIDYNIQFMAERFLKEASEDLNAVSGTVIVGNPNNGEILALANYPTFDPNNYRGVSLETFKNNATQSLFEPGSAFKPIIMAMGIEENVVTPQTTYYDEGYERVSGHMLRNYGRRSWGEVTMAEIMEKSINTGMVYLQQQLENDIFLDYLEDFNFFKKTDIELQGEVASENLIFKQGYDVNFANASFGQGIEVTPIQLIRSFFALANGGELMTPRITKTLDPKTYEGERVLSSGTTSKITSMLINVVENGTAQRAQIPGYYIAGKTGTSQIPWAALGENRRGYSSETMQTFVGYGPLNAEFVILVKMNQPDSPTAELSVVPVFRKLAEYVIDYKQIPPDYIRD